MDIIYSRKRIKVPKINNRKKVILKKVLKIAIIILIAIFTSTYTISSIQPIFDDICKSQAKAIATKVSNEEATEVMKNYKYEDIITITRNQNNNITGIEFNIITINEIISDVAIRTQEKLDDFESKDVAIALGTFTGSKILTGRGPKINYKIISIGDVETDYRSEFKQAGINQTLHKIYLQVSCQVSILTPFKTIEQQIQNQVILAENIIVGEIPQTYYNFNGLEDKDVLEIIE